MTLHNLIYKNHKRARHLGKTTYCVDGKCGSGKTHQTSNYISNHYHETNVLYVAPTKRLLHQTKTMLENRQLRPTLLCDENSNSVQGDVLDFIKQADDRGNVLLITFETYANLAFFHDEYRSKSNWEIFIDEMPQLDRYVQLSLPWHTSFLTNHLEVIDSRFDRLSDVLPLNEGKMEKIVRRGFFEDNKEHKDEFDRILGGLFKYVLSPGYDVFVETARWNKIIPRPTSTKVGKKGLLHFIAMLKPKLFRDVTLLSANVRNYMLTWWLEEHGHVMVEHEEITKGLRSIDHNAENIKIYYFWGARYSKWIRNTKARGDQTIGDVMDETALEVFGDEPFLAVENNDKSDTDDSVTVKSKNAAQLPVKAHGLNDYQHYQNIYFSPALNRPPAHIRLLDLFKHDKALPYKEAAEVAYQCVMRTGLRDPNTQGKYKILVPDKLTASVLSVTLGGAKIKSLLDQVESKVQLLRRDNTKEPDNIEIDSETPEIKEIPESLMSNTFSNLHGGYGVSLRASVSSKLDEIDVRNGSTYLVTLFDDDIASNPETVELTWSQFRDAIKDSFHSCESIKICPSVFKDHLSKNLDNFHAAFFIVLDFDGSKTFGSDDFIKTFWQTGQGKQDLFKTPFVLHSTKSRTRGNPNYFRVWIPIKPCYNVALYKIMCDFVIAKLPQDSGIDLNSKNIVKTYDAPNIHHDYLFEARGTRERDLARYLLDPNDFIRELPTFKYETVDQPRNYDAEFNAKLRSEIEELKQDILLKKQDRHYDIFELTRKLSMVCENESEMRQNLFEIVTDRKTQKKAEDNLKQWREGYFDLKNQFDRRKRHYKFAS